jgi:hypothetical protein
MGLIAVESECKFSSNPFQHNQHQSMALLLLNVNLACAAHGEELVPIRIAYSSHEAMLQWLLS